MRIFVVQLTYLQAGFYLNHVHNLAHSNSTMQHILLSLVGLALSILLPFVQPITVNYSYVL